MEMNDKLIKICEKLKIEHVGIAPIGPYVELEKRIRERVEGGQLTGFESKDIKKLVNPRETMEDAESVIVCLFPYFSGNHEKANISKYAHSKDYHIIIKETLEKIGELLKQDIGDFKYRAFVDTGPLNDRYMAYLAGLGYYGWNQNIISEEYGSYVLIGYMINSYPFKINTPNNKLCQKCGACINVCPGGALKENYQMEPRKCLSFVTQKKEDLSEDEIKRLKKNGMIFGCDLCQDVCPNNQNPKTTPFEAFHKELVSSIVVEDINSLTNKSFNEKYGDRTFSWRGKKLLLRNLKYIK